MRFGGLVLEKFLFSPKKRERIVGHFLVRLFAVTVLILVLDEQQSARVAVVDGKAVERVIENLVINALEAMPDGGNLRVATWQENGSAFVSVADTGKGMTEEFMRERLFHPFATTKKKGIGLGLYSCRDIIEQHGGRIDVARKVSVGTEFKIILPLKADEPNTGELKAAAVGFG